MNKHVVVVHGGRGSEREVSLASGKEIGQALTNSGYKVSYIDPKNDNFIENLQSLNPDIVFNAMHGKFGEDGTLPAILDYARIPYTHSGVKASAIALDKDLTKIVAGSLGIKLPKSARYNKGEELSKEIQELIKFPFVIKPLADGSSCDMHIIREPEKFTLGDLKNLSQQTYLFEQYVKGREVAVAILDGKALGSVEITAKGEFYDYQAKYKSDDTQYTIPPKDIADDLLRELYLKIEALHKILGCKSISRSDLIFAEGEFFFLELNTHPGFTSHSLVPKIAKHCGLSMQDLVINLVNSASYAK